VHDLKAWKEEAARLIMDLEGVGDGAKDENYPEFVNGLFAEN